VARTTVSVDDELLQEARRWPRRCGRPASPSSTSGCSTSPMTTSRWRGRAVHPLRRYARARVEMSVPAQRVTEPLSALDRPHLADTTVWSKIQPHEALARWFNEEVRAGRILTCDVVALELLRSARNTDTFRTQSRLLGLLEHCPTGLDEHARAREVQRSLAEQGRHRGIPPADLLINSSGSGGGERSAAAPRPRLRSHRGGDRPAGVLVRPRRVPAIAAARETSWTRRPLSARPSSPTAPEGDRRAH